MIEPPDDGSLKHAELMVRMYQDRQKEAGKHVQVSRDHWYVYVGESNKLYHWQTQVMKRVAT